MKESLEGKKEISKIHFLVHPGYIQKNDPDPNLVDNNVLAQNYIEKASRLGQDEMMIVFAPAIGEEFIREVREGNELYVSTIKRIKQILGDRAIILADDDQDLRGAVFMWNKDKIWTKIKNIAGKRGFVFRKKLEAEAYGEFMELCVKWISRHMQKASKIKEVKKVDIGREDQLGV